MRLGRPALDRLGKLELHTRQRGHSAGGSPALRRELNAPLRTADKVGTAETSQPLRTRARSEFRRPVELTRCRLAAKLDERLQERPCALLAEQLVEVGRGAAHHAATVEMPSPSVEMAAASVYFGAPNVEIRQRPERPYPSNQAGFCPIGRRDSRAMSAAGLEGLRQRAVFGLLKAGNVHTDVHTMALSPIERSASCPSSASVNWPAK